MIFCGCDPGLTGAFAAISTGPDLITIYDFQKTPENRISPYDFKEHLDSIFLHHNEESALCCLEKSQAMHGQGIVSAFTYGITYGILYSALVISNYDIIEVSPMKWKKEFDLNSNKKLGIVRNKEDSINVAISLFPEQEHNLRTQKKKGGFILHHGRAEALLMAEYARRNFYGN